MDAIRGAVKDFCTKCEYFDPRSYECVFRGGTYFENDTVIICDQFKPFEEEEEPTMDNEQRIERIKSLVNELKELYGAENAYLFLEYEDEYGVPDEYVIRLKSCTKHTDGSPVHVRDKDQEIRI